MRFYSQQLISGSNLVPSSIVPISYAPPASLFASRLSSPFIRPSRVIGFGCPPMAFSYQMPLTSSSSPPKTMPYQMPIPPSSTSSTTSLPLQYASGQFASNPCLPAPSIDHSVCPIEVRGGTVYFSPENQQPPKKSLGKMVYFDVEQQSATVSRPTPEKRPNAAIAIIDPKVGLVGLCFMFYLLLNLDEHVIFILTSVIRFQAWFFLLLIVLVEIRIIYYFISSQLHRCK